ncbi:uncharacterized protein LOC119839646 [Zerene cesonia]|uniref:uncharacterized protein LOC119839646 n=1 Tax=Zerene cesonia TaxID=33412 RepID=UPI0018E541E1|nr:uncharacterized protein LOC119839646 [Zerene cesonia]
MESERKNKLLQVYPNTLDEVRKEINLGKPGEMEQAVKLVREWIQQQPHFKKKDFTDTYIEANIVASKGSTERAKKAIDKACTMRTLWPHFFNVKDIRTEYAEIHDIGSLAIMPQLTKEHHRIVYINFNKPITKSTQILQHYKFGCCIVDSLRRFDVVGNIQYILDMRQANMANFLTSFNLMEFRQAYSIFIDCYSFRIKGIHVVSSSRLVESFIGILKQILKPKLISRLHHYPDSDGLIKVLGKEYLPSDAGGNQKSAKEIQDDWIEALSSKENMEYLRNINEGGTDESLRLKSSFNEDYAGMPGSFRLLTVD